MAVSLWIFPLPFEQMNELLPWTFGPTSVYRVPVSAGGMRSVELAPGRVGTGEKVFSGDCSAATVGDGPAAVWCMARAARFVSRTNPAVVVKAGVTWLATVSAEVMSIMLMLDASASSCRPTRLGPSNERAKALPIPAWPGA